MLAKEFSWVPFHVVGCNSQENGTDIELLQTSKQASDRSWESKRNGPFPVEIIIRFHYRCEISNALLSTKLDKNISNIELYIGDGMSGSYLDAEYRLAGTKDQINNKPIQVPLQGIGNYLKIKINHKPKQQTGNPFSQVSLATLRIWGRYTNYNTKIFNHEIPLETDKDNVDKILIGTGIPIDMIGYYEEDMRQWECAPIDSETKITVADLQKLKQQALVQQDYEMLKALTQDLKKVFEIGQEIQKLQRELNFALAKEDFNRAMMLKKRLIDLRNRRDGFDALYETTRYENMITNVRPSTAEYNNMIRLMDEEAEADRLRNMPRQATPQDIPPPSQDYQQPEPIQQQDDDDRAIKGAEGKDVPWWEKATGKDMKFKQKRKKKQEEEKIDKIESAFKNPYAFNEGDVDLELYFKPLITNTGTQVEDIPAEMLRRLYNLGFLTVFGAKVWNAIYSENWRHREAAAQAVLNFIEMPLPDKYLDGKSKVLFLACMELAKIACEDKILSIYFIGLKILSTTLSPPVCGTDVSPKTINNVVKEFIPILLEKIAELNFRSRDITMHTLLSVFKHPAVQVGELVKQSLKSCIEDPNFSSLYVPPDKQPERVIKGKLEIILSIVQEQGIDERQWGWSDVFIYLCVPSLFHPSNEVRMLSIELIVAMYLVIGEEVRTTVVDVDMKPNLFEILMERMNEVKEQAVENQKIRDQKREEILREEEEKRQRQEMHKSQGPKNNNRSKSAKKKQYKPGDYNEFQEEVKNLQQNIEEKGVTFTLDCLLKYKNSAKPLFAVISMNPPANFYNGTVDGSCKLASNIDYQSAKEYPHFKNTFCDFLNVPPQANIIIDLKFLDNVDKKVIKDYGWTFLPVYSETGELNNGEIQLPLFKPPIEIDTLRGLLGQPNQMEYLHNLIDTKKTPAKYLDQSTIVVRLSDFKKKNKREYAFEELNYSLLPPKQLAKLQYNQKMFDTVQKEKVKNFVGKMIPSKKTEEEFHQSVELAIKEKLNLDPVEPTL